VHKKEARQEQSTLTRTLTTSQQEERRKLRKHLEKEGTKIGIS